MQNSLEDIHGSVETRKKKGWFRKLLAFSGPAYLVSVGYMDPGNWATDIAGGSQFGYQLIWVILMSNIMALILQSLCARLGIVRGRDLAQANRETYPKIPNFFLYILAELAIAATDLAEVLGMAIGLSLLFDLPLLWGISLTVLDTFIILALQRLGMRKIEAFILALIAVIGCSLLIDLIMARPDLGDVATGFIPSIPDAKALYIAIGIIGATVMPHNLYLHSALVQTRKIDKSKKGLKEAIKMNIADSAMALNLAFFVNAGLLVLAGTVFFTSGNHDIAGLQDAYKLLEPLLGTKLAPILFAVALIAAGQSSTVTGTLAGQIVMEGHLQLRIAPWMRRIITRMAAIIPAFVVILIAGEDSVEELLIFSQVFLSLQLGFAIIPLIHFVSDKKLMGDFAIHTPTKIIAWLITALLIYLNCRLVTDEIVTFLSSNDSIWIGVLVIGIALALVLLFVYTFAYPLMHKEKHIRSARMHTSNLRKLEMKPLPKPEYQCIAMALDFSHTDEVIISNALSQGNEHTEFILIHIIESASATMYGAETVDYETQTDKEQLDLYVQTLNKMGYRSKAVLGHSKRSRSIAKIVKDQHADLLVMSGHGHQGLKDWIYGETVNKVRHRIDIPLLLVR